LKNLYHILGLPDFSSIEEVKKSFRKLAVLYHPDKNPEGAERFKEILSAYEILSDPELKAKYDLSLKNKTGFLYPKQTTRRSPFKEKNFADEREMERRKYYGKYYQSNGNKKSRRFEKKPVPKNEFRNILIAIPLTVFLLMLLLNFFERSIIGDNQNHVIISSDDKKDDTGKERWYGRKMYYHIFPVKNVSEKKSFMQISNQSGKDIIILFLDAINPDTLIQSVYLPGQYITDSLEFPVSGIKMRIQSGKNYNPLLELNECKGILGGFEQDEEFRETSSKVIPSGQKIELKEPWNGFEKISRCRFFGR